MPAAKAAVSDPNSANYSPGATIRGVVCDPANTMTGGSELVSCFAQVSDGTSFSTPVIVAADGRSYTDQGGTSGATVGSDGSGTATTTPSGVACPAGQTAVFGVCNATQAVDPAVDALLPAGTSPNQCSAVQPHMTDPVTSSIAYGAAATCDDIASANFLFYVHGVDINYANDLQYQNRLPTAGGCTPPLTESCVNAWPSPAGDGTVYIYLGTAPFQMDNGHAVSEGCPSGSTPAVLLYDRQNGSADQRADYDAMIAIDCGGNANQLWADMNRGLFEAGST